jgi:type IV secretory pathway VirJ component
VAVCAIILAVVVAGFLFHARKAADAVAPNWLPVTEQRVSHGRFDAVAVYIPHGSPQGFVLLLSGADGWTPAMDGMARGIAAHGAMVAGLDTPKFNAVLEKDGGQCVFPDGDLENLSRFVQAYFHLPTYLSPILAGDSTGATLAYATLVQAPKNTFAGAVSVDFCPNYPLTKPLCKDSGIEFTPHARGNGVDFLPSMQPGHAWSVIQQSDHPECDLESVRSFVAQVPGARFIAVKGGTAPESGSATAALSSAVEALMAQHPAAPAAAIPSALSDLPIVIVPAEPGTPSSDTFAIILSGDGGWAGLDKDVAGALTATGIPVIGLDSLRYFWSARTPAGLAADLDRLAGYYINQLGKQRVLLIGYSQGADVLPFAVTRLNASIRSHVALTAVMGMSEHALFEFHMTNWVSDDDSGPATLPEVDKITGMPVLCIYGEEETDTLCPKLDPHKATIVKLKGGHHFDGNYPALAKIILSAAAH